MRKVPVLSVLMLSFVAGMGCGGPSAEDKNPNPGLGEINTSPLPKRGDVKSAKKK
jgi:hypothetical protein